MNPNNIYSLTRSLTHSLTGSGKAIKKAFPLPFLFIFSFLHFSFFHLKMKNHFTFFIFSSGYEKFPSKF